MPKVKSENVVMYSQQSAPEMYLNNLLIIPMQAFTGRGPEGDQSSGGVPGSGPDVVRALTCLIQDNELVFGDRLGSGSFGVVKKAEWHTPTGRVVGLLVPARILFTLTY